MKKLKDQQAGERPAKPAKRWQESDSSSSSKSLCIVLRDRVHGGLAQLGERVLCKHEVIGSSPIFSIYGLIAQLVRAHA